jgi:hypothetical protein
LKSVCDILLCAVDFKAYGYQWLGVSEYFYKNMAVLASRPCKMYINQ